MSDVFDLFGLENEVEVDPKVLQAIEQLALAVGDLQGFEKEPDLFMVALAVQEVLEATGRTSHAAGAWVRYEQGHRRTSKLEEARARADALYRADLEHIQGWDPIYKTEQSALPWRQPGTVASRGDGCSSESGAASATGSDATKATPTATSTTSTVTVPQGNAGER
jgi:hypothetical protein